MSTNADVREYVTANLVQWLRNKYDRHGELEDKYAAEALESYALKLSTLQDDYAQLLQRWKEEQKMRLEAESRLSRCVCGAGDTRKHELGCVLPWFHGGDCSDTEPPEIPVQVKTKPLPSAAETQPHEPFNPHIDDISGPKANETLPEGDAGKAGVVEGRGEYVSDVEGRAENTGDNPRKECGESTVEKQWVCSCRSVNWTNDDCPRCGKPSPARVSERRCPITYGGFGQCTLPLNHKGTCLPPQPIASEVQGGNDD